MTPKTCSQCGERGRCKDSRAHRNSTWWRRYHCACGARWSTFEARSAEPPALRVVTHKMVR